MILLLIFELNVERINMLIYYVMAILLILNSCMDLRRVRFAIDDIENERKENQLFFSRQFVIA